MAIMRVTFFFKNSNSAGWTETLFTNAADCPSAMVQAKNILPFRKDLQGTGSRIAFIRVSDDLVARDSLVYPVPPGDGVTAKRVEDNDADIASTCALVRAQAGFTKRRSFFLRGVPDNITQNNGIYTPSAVFRAAFDLWSLAVRANGGCIKLRIPAAAPIFITNVTPAGPTGIVTITTVAAHGFFINQVANIKQVIGATQVRGLNKILTVPTPDTFTIRVNRVVKPYVGGGTVNVNAYTLSGISDLEVIRCSHHNAGRPFDVPRGRRLVR